MEPLVLNRLLQTVAHVDLTRPLSDGYFYAHLGHCVTDAVYSIGAHYSSTRAVPARYAAYQGLTLYRPAAVRPGLPPVADQQTLGAFVASLAPLSDEALAAQVFGNAQRTSTRNGILKAEAVRRFAQVLVRHGIHTFQDVDALLHDLNRQAQIEAEIHAIPGQGSGLSWDYFLMLAGGPDGVKADRMILRWLARVLGYTPQRAEAIALVRGLAKVLQAQGVATHARHLDHCIWNAERGAGPVSVPVAAPKGAGHVAVTVAASSDWGLHPTSSYVAIRRAGSAQNAGYITAQGQLAVKPALQGLWDAYPHLQRATSPKGGTGYLGHLAFASQAEAEAALWGWCRP
jgi:hypothetical protein